MLSAFLDGRLPAAERAEVMAHLADCAECFGLFADTAEAVRELEPAGGAIARFPLERRERLRQVLPVAAAAVLVLVVGLSGYSWVVRPPGTAMPEAIRLALYNLYWRPPRVEVAEVVRPLRTRRDLSDRIRDSILRGETEAAPGPAAEAFRVGARRFDFQLGVETGNAKAASRAAQRVMIVLHENGFYPDEERRFTGAFHDLDRARALTKAYRGLVEEVTPALEEGFSPPYLDFGTWTAAGRLYAIAQNRTFFRSRTNRRFLRLLLEHPERLNDGEPMELPIKVRGQLQKVARIWDAGRFAPADYAAIADSLTRILDIYERMTDDPGA